MSGKKQEKIKKALSPYIKYSKTACPKIKDIIPNTIIGVNIDIANTYKTFITQTLQ